MGKLVQVLSTGTYPDSANVEQSFTEADLDQIASSYDPDKFVAPFLDGHDETKDNHGLVKRVVRLGKKLFVEPYKMSAAFVERVNSGRIPGLSVSLYPPGHPSSPAPNGWALRHVAGVQIPAWKGLAAPEFNEADPNMVVDLAEPEVIDAIETMERSLTEMFSAIRDTMIELVGLEKVNSTFPVWRLDDIKYAIEQLRTTPEAPPAIVDDMPQFSERETLLDLRQRELDRKEFLLFCENLSVVVDPEIADLYTCLPNSVVDFSEGHSSNPRETLKKILQNIAIKKTSPSLPSFAEFATSENNTTIVAPYDVKRVSAKAREILNANPALGTKVVVEMAEKQLGMRH